MKIATPHEFVAFPLYAQDRPDHVCKGSCACQLCDQPKGDRDVHLQPRDARRPKP